MNELVLDQQVELAELAAIEAESIGWLPLGDGAYLHVGKPEEEEIVITVVGVPDGGDGGDECAAGGVVMPKASKPDPALVAVLINREHSRLSSQVKTLEKALHAPFSDKEHQRLIQLAANWRALLAFDDGNKRTPTLF